MNSLILKLSANALFPVLTLLSLLALYRGHNQPGGGFIGGLILSAALILKRLNETQAQKSRLSAPLMLKSGLALAILPALLPLLSGGALLKSLWLPEFSLPLLGVMHVGTPLIFDLGVMLIVAAFILTVVNGLEETE